MHPHRQIRLHRRHTLTLALLAVAGCATLNQQPAIPANGALRVPAAEALQLVMTTMESARWTVTDADSGAGIVGGSRTSGIWSEFVVVRVPSGADGGSNFRVTVSSGDSNEAATRAARQLRDLIQSSGTPR